MPKLYDIPAGDGLRRLIRNAREEAIYDVLGGVNEAATAMNVKRQSIYYLLTKPRIQNVDTAKRLADATAKAGRLVPTAEILGLEPWQGPERNGTDPQREARHVGKAESTAAHSPSDLAVSSGDRLPQVASLELDSHASSSSPSLPGESAPAQNRTGTKGSDGADEGLKEAA